MECKPVHSSKSFDPWCDTHQRSVSRCIEYINLQGDEARKIIQAFVDCAPGENWAEELCAILPKAEEFLERTAPKQICEHKWAHIEDHHVICEKCKHTADLCWTCESEQEKVGGRLVCPKCVK